MEKIDFYKLSDYTTEPRGIKNKIILHWSASDYDSVFDDYHVNITGNGDIYIDGSLADVRRHCWHRNTRTIGISISCMRGAEIWEDGTVINGDYPPKDIQLEIMGKVVAKLCIEVGIPLTEVYTHAEIAIIDGYGLGSGDKDMRWDLLHQGDEIRKIAKNYMNKWQN